MALTLSAFFDKNPGGRILNRFTRDVAIIDENLLHFLVELINLSSQLLVNLAFIVLIVPPTLVALVLYSLLLFYTFTLVAPLSRELRKLELLSRSPLLTSLNTILKGVVSIRLHKLRDKFIFDVNEAARDNLKSFVCYHIVLRYMQFLNEMGALLTASINAAVLVAMKGTIAPEFAAVTLTITATTLGLSSMWAKTMVESENYMVSTQRLMEIAQLDAEGNHEAQTNFKITTGQIVFKKVYMKYQPHMPFTLKNLSFKIEGGSKVGVIGRTGSGKSSIIQVLFRLTEPRSGTIWIDDQDYTFAGLNELRLQMSVIPQDPFILKTTVRENLDPFREHSDASIYEALEQVRLLSLVDKLENKLDTPITAQTLSLSTGQKQLICLARAILRKSRIVIMDEATANLDPETAKFIQSQLKSQFKGSTIIMIAHRLRTIIDCDKIIVINEGACTEQGTPRELRDNEESDFRNMIEHASLKERNYLMRKLSTIRDFS